MKTEMDRYNAAIQMIRDLCEGRRSWILSVPVRVDYDPDVVLVSSLNDVPALLHNVTQLEDKIESIIAEFEHDPVACLQMIGEHISLRRHYRAHPNAPRDQD
jgi:hypothetical protein